MAFLDNSGDIILDAVLTDLGRERMARGTFSIAKFALGDEEINYSLYNGQHPSGSTHFDLDILKTPILEAFTSDQSIMKSRLISLSRDNILYLPTFKINTKDDSCKKNTGTFDGHILMADTTTFNVNGNAVSSAEVGFLHGVPENRTATTTHICVDQGIAASSSGMSVKTAMDSSLVEGSYLVKLDSRLLMLEAFLSNDNTPRIEPSFVDDDGINTYYIRQGQGSAGGAIMGPRSRFAPRSRDKIAGIDSDATRDINEIKAKEEFDGPLGTVLRITPRVTSQIQQSNALFDELGSTAAGTISFRGATISSYKFIDTLINVTGVTTGFSIDIPIRIIKGTAFS